VLTGCVLVIAALGLLVRGQARPDGLDSAIDGAVVASFSRSPAVLPWLALPGSTIPLIAVSVALGAGTVLALAFLIDLAPGALPRRTGQ
jgi:hypothetical protein